MTGFLGKPFLPVELFAVVEGLGARDGEPGASPGAPAVAAGPVDLEGLRRRLRDADAEDAVDDLLDVFRRTAPASFTEVERAIEARDPAAIARAAHAFRSASGAIGALGLASLLHTIERTALGSGPAEPGFPLRQIRAEYERVMGALLPAQESI